MMSVSPAVRSAAHNDLIPTISPEYMWEVFISRPTREARAYFEAAALSREHLSLFRDTHLLVANIADSIHKIQSGANPGSLMDESGIKIYRYFMHAPGAAEWFLLRKCPADGSAGRSRDEQFSRFSRGERMPLAQQLVCAMIAWRHLKGEELFKDTVVRTSSFTCRGSHVALSFIDGRIRIFEEVGDNDRELLYGDKRYPIHAATCRRPWVSVTNGSDQRTPL